MNPNASSHKSRKKEILLALIEHLERELSLLITSAKAAHLAATHEESRAEDRHDTFAIEASYLAAGQSARVQDLNETINELRGHLESALPFQKAGIGALVTLLRGNKESLTYLARHGGGTQIPTPDGQVSLLSPESPLGEMLIDLCEGDEFTVESKTGEHLYRITQVE